MAPFVHVANLKCVDFDYNPGVNTGSRRGSRKCHVGDSCVQPECRCLYTV